MEVSDMISAGALVVATIAAAITMLNHFTSLDVFSLNKSEFNEKNKGMSLYLADSYKWKQDDKTYVSFSIRLINKASRSNGIVNIDLYLDIFDERRVVSTVKLSPADISNPVRLESTQEVICCPITLGEKSATSGWITFEIPKHITKESSIDLYKIVAYTVDDESVSVDTHLVNLV
ncbi:hypothetical protein QXB71_003905 [Vibrio cholerae]|nr:hypothetical protein [Vibrio cholerae]